MTPHILGLFAGQPAPLGGGSRLSSIVKHPVDRLTLTATGPQEDQQADLTVHGGVDKAVHLYPVEHYAALAQAFPAAAAVLGSGFLGENVSLAGLCEDRLRLGDRLVIGDAVLGDGRCGVNIAAYRATATVSAASARMERCMWCLTSWCRGCWRGRRRQCRVA